MYLKGEFGAEVLRHRVLVQALLLGEVRLPLRLTKGKFERLFWPAMVSKTADLEFYVFFPGGVRVGVYPWDPWAFSVVRLLVFQEGRRERERFIPSVFRRVRGNLVASDDRQVERAEGCGGGFLRCLFQFLDFGLRVQGTALGSARKRVCRGLQRVPVESYGLWQSYGLWYGVM